MDNIAGLECSDRVRKIGLLDIGWDWEKLLVAMQKPFPELSHLSVSAGEGTAVLGTAWPPLPDSFLGGSTPSPAWDSSTWRVFNFRVYRIYYCLPLTSPRLTGLFIKDISPYGYIPPEVVIDVLSTLTCLEDLGLGFEDFHLSANRAPPPEPPWVDPVLPVLGSFWFKGVSEYWEVFARVFVAHINAPELRQLDTTFYNATEFDTPQLVQFIYRTPLSNTLGEACVTIEDHIVTVILDQLPSLEKGAAISCLSAIPKPLLSCTIERYSIGPTLLL